MSFNPGDKIRVHTPHLGLETGFTGTVISRTGTYILMRGADGDNYDAFAEMCELVSAPIYEFALGDEIRVHTAHAAMPVGFTGIVVSTTPAKIVVSGKKHDDKYDFNYILRPEHCKHVIRPGLKTLDDIVYAGVDSGQPEATYAYYDRAPVFRSPHPQKEKAMSLNTFETVAFINGNRLDSYTAENLVDLISREEAAIEKLKAVKSMPKRINDEIKRREKTLRELVDFLDEHDADNTPS